MKLEEAASILGVSLDDITVDGLKQTYKKLALAWESEKSVDQNLKGKYQQVSEAYKKIISAMEDREPFRGDDSHEVAAFMRMFMDMVGISESDSIPAAMTFGMMFGSNQNIVEEWSTDEDGEGEYDDDEDDDDCDEDDEDDEEYLPDEYFDEYAAVGPSGFPVHMAMPHPGAYPSVAETDPRLSVAQQAKAPNGSWEPQVKQYSNMNLKDQLNSQRAQTKHGELADDDTDPGDVGDNGEELTEAEKERKLKLAKKRAEKRKKQKEKEKKKSREANGTQVGEGDADESKSAGRYNLDFSDMSSEDLTGVIQKFADQIVAELTQSVTNGQLGKVNQILSYDFVEEMPALVATETVTRLKEILPAAPLLHQCVTNFARGGNTGSGGNAGNSATAAAATGAGAGAGAGAGGNAEAYNTAMLTALAARRLEVAKYLLAFNRPALELGTTNASGLSVLHYAVANGDLKVAQAVLRALAQTSEHEDRKPNLNVNSRCHRQGWAPLHYAVDRLDVEAVRLLAQHGANLQATVATDRRQTPMELAKQKLKAANSAGKAAVQVVIDELQGAIDRNKASREAEAKIKRQQSESQETQEKKAEPAAASTSQSTGPTTAPEPAENTASASATKTDKKKKKKDKSGSTAVAMPTPAAPTPKSAETSASPANLPSTVAGKTAETVPAPAAAPMAPAPTAAAPAKNKKGKAAKAAAAARAGQTGAAPVEPAINPIAEMSVSSRDELVDRLLAMGFRESDCLQAIALYGTDIDRAISWLCEKPVGSASGADGEASRGGEGPAAAAAPASATAPSTSTSAATTAPGSAQKLQKEKEDLRKINQAWNQKALEDKRKAEALKKQQELEKQQAELLAKQQAELQRQQQAQQEYLYQAHLQQQQQQYLALQQAHMQTYFAAQQAQAQAQQAAMFGGAPGMGVGAGAGVGGLGGSRTDGTAAAYGMLGGAANTANYPLGSLGHMANMLASNAAGSHAHGAAPGLGGGSFPHSAGPPGISSTLPGAAPSLQTLSGAMAMAMGPSTGTNNSASVSLGAQSTTPSLRDAVAMTYSTPHTGLTGTSPRLSLSGSSPPRGDALSGVSGAGAFGLGLGGAQNSLGLFGSADPLSGLGAFPSSGLSNGLGGGSNINNSSSRDVFQQQEAFVDGALELSAGAKPFVPRFGSSAGASGLTTSPASSTLSGPSLGAFGVGSGLGSSLGGLGLGAPGLGGSSWNTGSISLDASKPDGSKLSDGFLSSLLSTELNLDEDAFDASAIIPDLDSFLLNDN